jgi:hypothetical protein
MMPPAVALLWFGPGPLWVPVPLILLWPFLFAALAVGGLVEAATRGGALTRTRTLCVALGQLRGVRVDVQSATGTRVHLWVV